MTTVAIGALSCPLRIEVDNIIAVLRRWAVAMGDRHITGGVACGTVARWLGARRPGLKDRSKGTAACSARDVGCTHLCSGTGVPGLTLRGGPPAAVTSNGETPRPGGSGSVVNGRDMEAARLIGPGDAAIAALPRDLLGAICRKTRWLGPGLVEASLHGLKLDAPNSDGAATRCVTLQPRACCPAVRSAVPISTERPHGLLLHQASAAAGPALLLLLGSPDRGCTLLQGLVPTACRTVGAGPREQVLDRSTLPDTCLKGPATKQFEEALRLREEPWSCDCCANCVS